MKSRIILLSLLCLLLSIWLVNPWTVAERATEKPPSFTPPTAREQQRAIGSTRGLPNTKKRTFAAEGFEAIPIPESLDWLANHHEPGQTFGQFTSGKPNRPNAVRNKLYFQPVGEFDNDLSPRFDELQKFAEAYFGLEVRMLPPIPYDKLGIKNRKNQGRRQYLTTDILSLLKGRLPSDAYCLLAITMEDLYPAESWNFVFGQASLKNRVGVYSFARYDPRERDEKPTDEHCRIVLRRSCKVLAHETAHMFGMQHCIYFKCVVNGSNHMRESDSREIHMCPVCLRKLQWSLKSNLIERYKNLSQTYSDIGLKKEAAWTKQRLEFIETGTKE